MFIYLFVCFKWLWCHLVYAFYQRMKDILSCMRYLKVVWLSFYFEFFFLTTQLSCVFCIKLNHWLKWNNKILWFFYQHNFKLLNQWCARKVFFLFKYFKWSDHNFDNNVTIQVQYENECREPTHSSWFSLFQQQNPHLISWSSWKIFILSKTKKIIVLLP